MAARGRGRNNMSQRSNQSEENSNHSENNEEGFQFMEEHYNSASNSYALGPGKELEDSLQPGNLAKSGTKVENVKLYVGNIPQNLHKGGLFNIFTPFGQIIDLHFDSVKRFGFVYFRTQAEALDAINKLSGAAPYNMHVTFANSRSIIKKESEEEVAKEADSENKPNNQIQQGRKSFCYTRPPSQFDKEPPINKGHVKRIVTLSSNTNHRVDEDALPIYGQPTKYDTSNKIIQNRTQQLRKRSNFPGVNRNMNDSQARIPLQYNMEGFRDPERNKTFEILPCSFCKKNCIKECHRCGSPYCSPDCQTKDWPNHRTLCFPMPKLVYASKKPNIAKVPETVNGSLNCDSITDNGIAECSKVDNKLFSGQVVIQTLSADTTLSKTQFEMPITDDNKVNNEANGKPCSLFLKLKASSNRLKKERSVERLLTVQEPWETSVSLPNDCYTEVAIINEGDDGSFYAHLSCNFDIVQKLVEEGNKDDLILEPETNLSAGTLCFAMFDDLYYRAKIISVSPVKVFFLDYGNVQEFTVENMIKKLPSDYFKNIPKQSINIVDAPGGTQKLELSDSVKIIPTNNKNINGAVEVKIEGAYYPEVMNTETDNGVSKPVVDESKTECDTAVPSQDLRKAFENNLKRRAGSISTSATYNALKAKLKPKENKEQGGSLVFPELTIGACIKITVQCLEQDFAWVADTDNSHKANKILFKINNAKISRRPIARIVVGSLGIVNYKNVLYRCVIIIDQPLTVWLLDYGNTVQVEKYDIMEIVEEELLTKTACVVKVALAPGSLYKFNKEAEYDIEVIEKKNDHYIVTVRGDESAVNEEIDPKEWNLIKYLKKIDSGELHVKKLYCHNQAIVSFQIPDLLDTFKSEHDNLQKIFLSEQPSIEATIGDSVAVKYENTYERCEILSVTDKQEYVLSAYDIGMIFESTTVYSLPQNFRYVPRLIYNLKITNLDGCPRKFQNSMMNGNSALFKVTMLEPETEIKCSFPDNPEDVFIANVTKWIPNPSTSSLKFLPIPDPKKDNIVVITEIINQNRIYVKEIDKAKNEKYDQLLQKVAIHAIKAEPFKLFPVKDEPVVALFSDGNYYRALVKKINSDESIEVFYTEFGNSDIVLLNNIREISDELKAEPVYIHKIGLADVLDGPLTAEASLLFESIRILDPPTKFKLKFDSSFPKVHLIYPDGKSFNNEVDELLTPRWRELEHLPLEKQQVIQLGEIVFLRDLKIREVPLGENIRIVVLDTALLSSGTFFGCYNDLSFMQKILDVQPALMAEYCENIKTSYSPRTEEACIAKFPHDNVWYRAVCCDPDQERCHLFSVDIGIFCAAHIDNIRRMVPDFLADECLAAQFYIKGLPEFSEGQIDVVNNYVATSHCSILARSVTKSEDGDSYVIELPSDLMKLLEDVK